MALLQSGTMGVSAVNYRQFVDNKTGGDLCVGIQKQAGCPSLYAVYHCHPLPMLTVNGA